MKNDQGLLGLGIIALALAGVLVFLLQSETDEGASSTEQEEEVVGLLPDAPDLFAEELPAQRTARSVERPVSAPPAGSVDCTIVALDSKGARHVHESGTLLYTYPDKPGDRVWCDVEQGRFQVPRRHTGGVRIQAVTLSGIRLTLDAQDFLFPEEGPLELTGRWEGHSLLSVVDSLTGVELDNVLVIKSDFSAGHDAYPSGWTPTDVIHEAAQSPVRLNREGARSRLWIHSPGYTWVSAYLSFMSGEQRVIQLSANGGVLLVTLTEPLPEERPFIRIYQGTSAGQEELIAEELAVDGSARFRGIPAGTFALRAEYGRRSEPKIVLGTAPAVVTAGTESAIRLALDAAPASGPMASIEGVVECPLNRRPADQWWLHVARQDGGGRSRLIVLEAEDYASDKGGFTFRVGQLPLGTYDLSLSGHWSRVSVELPANGVTGVRIPTRELVPIVVNMIDSTSGEAVDVRGLSTRPFGAEESWFGATYLTDSSYTARVPIGTLELRVRTLNYSHDQQTIEVSQAAQEFSLSLTRRPGFWLRLLDGETPVPFGPDTALRCWNEELGEGERREPGGWRTRTERTADGRVVTVSTVGRIWMSVPAPGEYTLEIGEIAGFRPIPALVVPVTWEGQQSYEFPLERK